MPDSSVDATDAVLTVVREILGHTDIGPEDDFYLVGGHSLLIIPITRRLHDEFGLDLDIRQFGLNPQLAALVAACRRTTTADVGDDAAGSQARCD